MYTNGTMPTMPVPPPGMANSVAVPATDLVKETACEVSAMARSVVWGTVVVPSPLVCQPLAWVRYLGGTPGRGLVPPLKAGVGLLMPADWAAAAMPASEPVKEQTKSYKV